MRGLFRFFVFSLVISSFVSISLARDIRVLVTGDGFTNRRDFDGRAKALVSEATKHFSFDGQTVRFDEIPAFIPSERSRVGLIHYAPNGSVKKTELSETAFGLVYNGTSALCWFSEESRRGAMRSLGTKLREVRHNPRAYDLIIVIANVGSGVNNQKEGGCSHYNSKPNYVFLSSGASAETLVHEFGHIFGKLLDESKGGGTSSTGSGPNCSKTIDPPDHFWRQNIALGKLRGPIVGCNNRSAGIYRPSDVCLMLDSKLKEFCLVCKNAIRMGLNRLSRTKLMASGEFVNIKVGFKEDGTQVGIPYSWESDFAAVSTESAEARYFYVLSSTNSADPKVSGYVYGDPFAVRSMGALDIQDQEIREAYTTIDLVFTRNQGLIPGDPNLKLELFEIVSDQPFVLPKDPGVIDKSLIRPVFDIPPRLLKKEIEKSSKEIGSL